jgi:hypothetical protein
VLLCCSPSADGVSARVLQYRLQNLFDATDVVEADVVVLNADIPPAAQARLTPIFVALRSGSRLALYHSLPHLPGAAVHSIAASVTSAALASKRVAVLFDESGHKKPGPKLLSAQFRSVVALRLCLCQGGCADPVLPRCPCACVPTTVRFRRTICI